MTYFDWAATAKPDLEVLDAVAGIASRYYGNPSSIHAAGRESEQLLVESRNMLAEALGCQAQEVIFTSGGTESNNMVAFSVLQKLASGVMTRVKPRVVVSGIEHASVFAPVTTLQRLGFDTVVINTRDSGFIDPRDIRDAFNERTAMVLVMLVNNETGAIQPVAEIAACAAEYSASHGRRIHVHTDAVQALGKIPFCLPDLGVDTASLSGHKIGAPRGVGALYVRRGAPIEFLYTGGGQESERRPGTENLASIYGFALAARKAIGALQQQSERTGVLSQKLLDELTQFEGATVVPSSRICRQSDFSPYILNIAFPPIPGEVVVRVLEDEGFLVSTGSACSSRLKKRTRVLENMGLAPEIARSAVRFSFGSQTTIEDIVGLADAIKSKIPPMVRVFG